MRLNSRRRTIFCVLFVLLLCLDIIAGPSSTGKVESDAVNGGSPTPKKKHRHRTAEEKAAGVPKHRSSAIASDNAAEVKKEEPSSKMADTSKAPGAPKRVKSSHHQSRRHSHSSSRNGSIEVTDKRTLYYSGPRNHPLIPKDQNGEIIFTAQGRDRVTATRMEPVPFFGTMMKLFGLNVCTLVHSSDTMTPREARKLQGLADVRHSRYDYKGRRVYRLMQQAAADEEAERLILIKNKEIQDAINEGKKNVEKANMNTALVKKANEESQKEIERLKKELANLEKLREEDKAKHERETEKAVADARAEVQEIWMGKNDELRAEFEGKVDTATKKQDTIREEYEKRLKDLQASFDEKEKEYKAEVEKLQKRIDDLRSENDKDKKAAEERLKTVLLENDAAKRAAEDRVRLEEGEKHKLAIEALHARSAETLERKLKEALVETQKRITEAEAAAKNVVAAADKERDKNRIQHGEEQIKKLEIEGQSRDKLHELYANKIEKSNAIWVDVLALERKKAIDIQNQIMTDMTDAQAEAVEAERIRRHEAVEQVRKEWHAELRKVVEEERQRSISQLKGATEEFTSEKKAYERRIEELKLAEIGLKESLAQLQKALDEKEAYDAIVADDSASNVSAATTRVGKGSGKSKPGNPRVDVLKKDAQSEGGRRKKSGEKQRSGERSRAKSETGKSAISAKNLERLQASLLGAKNAGFNELYDARKLESYVKTNKDIENAPTGVDMDVAHSDLVSDLQYSVAEVMTKGHEKMTGLCVRPQGASVVSSIASLTPSKVGLPPSDISVAKQLPLPSSNVGKAGSDVSSVRTSSTQARPSRNTPAPSGVSSKNSRTRQAS